MTLHRFDARRLMEQVANKVSRYEATQSQIGGTKTAREMRKRKPWRVFAGLNAGAKEVREPNRSSEDRRAARRGDNEKR
ncbi:MAG: hypothetical protein ACF788_10650 [Novipirellula sp. JB048]